MPSVRIGDEPEENGPNRPTVAEVLARAAKHTGGSATFDDVVAIVRDDRDRR